MNALRYLAYSGLMLFVVFGSVPESRAVPQKDDGEDQLTTQVYNVSELVLPARNYPLRKVIVPSVIISGDEESTGGGGFSGFIPGAGGMGGGMGGGGFGFRSVPIQQVVQSLPAQFGGSSGGGGQGGFGGMSGPAQSSPSQQTFRFDIEALVETLIETVSPETWSEVGGPGGCVILGNLLVIQQTKDVHQKVTELLDSIRSEGGVLRSVTIEARWVLLNTQQLDALTADDSKEGVNLKMISSLPAENLVGAGRIVCFDGQTVHLVSGFAQTVVSGGVPVVGEGTVAYQPQVNTGVFGTSLQLTPTIMSDGRSALLDLKSIVTRSEGPAKSSKVAEATDPASKTAELSIDRLNMSIQQFATLARVNMNEPRIVGGMTFSAGGVGGDQHQLYLIVHVKAE